MHGRELTGELTRGQKRTTGFLKRKSRSADKRSTACSTQYQSQRVDSWKIRTGETIGSSHLSINRFKGVDERGCDSFRMRAMRTSAGSIQDTEHSPLASEENPAPILLPESMGDTAVLPKLDGPHMMLIPGARILSPRIESKKMSGRTKRKEDLCVFLSGPCEKLASGNESRAILNTNSCRDRLASCLMQTKYSSGSPPGEAASSTRGAKRGCIVG